SRACPTPSSLPKHPSRLELFPRPTHTALFPYTTLFRSWCGDRPRGQSRRSPRCRRRSPAPPARTASSPGWGASGTGLPGGRGSRSEEHTSELQSRENLVCRLLLEKKKETAGRTRYGNEK